MNFNSTGARAAALLALSLAASCASEPEHGRRGPPGGFGGAMERPSLIVRPGALLLIDFDADHDLKVSKAEMRAGAAQMFAAADSNHDKSLSPIEYSALAAAHLGTADSTPGRLAFDGNQDGAITDAEFLAGMETLFGEFDTDHDGFVTRAEMVQRLAEPSFGGGGPGEGGFGGGRGGPGGRRGGGGEGPY